MRIVRGFVVLLSLLLAVFGAAWTPEQSPLVVVESEPSAGAPPETAPPEFRAAGARPGVQRIDALPAAGAGTFQLDLPAAPGAIARAYLVYELAGVPHWTATVRSINGFPAHGGFAAAPSAGTVLQTEEINPRWLRPGLNDIQFFAAPAAGAPPSRLSNLLRVDAPAEPGGTMPYTVRNLRLLYLDGPAQARPLLVLSHPLQGENDDAGTMLRGFVDPAVLPSGPAELFVNESFVPRGIHPADGSFAVFVPRTAPAGEPWEARIEIVYPDGSRLRHTVPLTRTTSSDETAEGGNDAELDAGPDAADSIGFGKARLDVARGALRRKVKLTLRKLRDGELPAMDSGMTNVTPERGGFRFGPHGLRFAKPVELRLPYDAALIPRGLSEDDIRSFYFDEQAGRWIPLQRVSAQGGLAVDAADAEAGVIVSVTDHFTDFVNATLAIPDEPGGASYTPNSLEELAKPDPGAQIVEIEPPDAGPAGDAALTFPLTVPPGRRGMQPELAVHYSSGGNNGWLGVGWDLRLPSIEISTTFGVPRYDGTENYEIDGAALERVSPPSQKDAVVFVRRIEGSFASIVRYGTKSSEYWWKVTEKDGTVSVYGETPEARLQDPATDNIFRWHLQSETDTHGNSVDYAYATDAGGEGNDEEPWREVYPASIEYTRGKDVAAYYRVEFHRDAADTRNDRLSSGRQGFKTYMRHRLRRVDVLAGGKLVRRFDFETIDGDFHKTLLTAIVVKGKDASEFHRHSFEYVGMGGNPTLYDGFDGERTWSGIRSESDFTDTTRIGGGAHAFVGLGPPGCQPHAGLQVGGSGTQTTQRVTFLDLNGDGLPDRLTENGDVDFNEYDPVEDPNETGIGTFGKGSFAGTTSPGRTSEWSLEAGLGAHIEAGVTASVSGSYVWSHANDDRLMTDIDGDMLPDIVSTSGGLSVRRNRDGKSFSSGTPFDGFTSASLNLKDAKEEKQVLSDFRLADPIRALALPYAGRVTIAGAVRKVEAGGDGVDVSIFRDGTLLWKRRIAADDTAPCVPAPDDACGGGLTLDVAQGESLYFLAGSVRETSGDALEWAPVVAYDGASHAAVEPYGARTFVFDAREDFRLAGYDGPAWTSAATAVARIDGAIVKQQTPDEVTATIVRKRPIPGTEDHETDTLFTHTFAAAEATSFDAFPRVDVRPEDALYLTLTTPTRIDPASVEWNASITYEGTTTPAVPKDQLTQPARVAFVLPQFFQVTGPTQSWSAEQSGEQEIALQCAIPTTRGTLYVQGVNRLVLAVPFLAATAFTIPVTANEPLFFTTVGAAGPGDHCWIKNSTIPLNVLGPSGAARSLSGGHHGWFYGEFNGNTGFHPSKLIPPADRSAKPDYAPGAPNWNGAVGLTKPVWTAGGFDLSIGAEGMKPSRRGSNAAGVLDDASGITSGDGLSVLRKNTGHTAAFSASGGPAGLSASLGWNRTELDLVDMNGDRYPDQVSGGSGAFLVRFSNGKRFDPTPHTFAGGSSAVRTTDDVNIGLSAGLGVTFTRKSGSGKPSGVSCTLPSVGKTVSLSQQKTDLIDVNGDDLPDRVDMNPGDATMSVQLNLGYRFGRAETWTLPSWDANISRCTDIIDSANDLLSDNSDLNTFDALSFTRTSGQQLGAAVGPFGGGVSTSLSRTLVELADVNGDGLPDRVSKDQNDRYFRVQLNLGDRWDAEQHWSAGAWSESIGDGYDPGLFKCLDAVSFNGSREWNVSAGAPVCIPLVVVGIQIELSGQAFGTERSGMQLFLEDIDGDGLPDHILKKAGDSNVYVKRNKAGRVNLLSAVHRPLGSTLRLEYQRRGNHPNMPSSQWVVSKFTVDEPHSGASYVTRVHYDNDAYFDRAERESYGYGHVRITQPDGSTIDRHFSNTSYYNRHLLTKEIHADENGKLLTVVESAYEEKPVVTRVKFPALMAQTTLRYEPAQNAAPKKTGTTYTYDERGNVRFVADSGDAEIAGDEVESEVTYRTYPDSPLTRPATVESRDAAKKTLRRRQARYDALGALESLELTLAGGRDPANGFPYTGTSNAVWTYEYDVRGNLTKSTNPSGFITNVTYDAPTQTHPVEVTDSFGYLTKYDYALEWGVPAQTTDQNANVISQSFDAYGRVVQVVGPYDTTTPVLTFEYGRTKTHAWAVAHHRDTLRPADPIDSSVFIDTLGRVIQTKEDGDLDNGIGATAGMRVSGPVAFDRRSRVVSQGQPVFDTAGPTELVKQDAATRPTRFVYDGFDRIREVQFPHGAATKLAYGFASFDNGRRLLTTRTDAGGRATRFYHDVEGHIVGIEQTNTIAGAKKTLTTRYEYDPLHQLVAVTDAKGNKTRLEYDTLGRNVVLDNPDLGRTEYRYDRAGNLGAKITANLAARGQQIRYHYTTGRLDRIDFPESPDAVYIYGGPRSLFHRAGRVAAIVDASGMEERFYGKLGEIVRFTKTTAALNGDTPKGPYTTAFRYDDFGRLLSLVYPDGETLTYAYDSGGKVKSASGLLGGVRFDYLRHLGYDEHGSRTRIVYGNGVETRLTYDPQSRFVTQIRTIGEGRDLHNLKYKLDASGLVQSVSNDVPVPPSPYSGGPLTQTFRYDDIGQLIASEGGYRAPPNKQSAYTFALTYDEIGNTLTKKQLHQTGNGGKLNVEKKTSFDWTYAYGGPQPHAPVRIGERAFTYDRNGNQTGWTSDANGTRRTLVWDEENRVASIADNGQTTRFLYDAGGTRTNKAGPHGETTYVNRWFSLRNGAVASKHVFADDVRVSTKVSPDPVPQSEKVYFYQTNHLGSTGFVTDELGKVFQHLEYFPSGEVWVDERSETQRTPYHFSGKELDEETGLSYFGARYYDARQGQWISADPVLDGLIDVDQLSASASVAPFRLPGDLYAYSGNDPVNLIDPEGFGKYLSVVLTKDGIVHETWDMSEIMKKFPNTYKEHVADIKYKAAMANKMIKKMNAMGVPVTTSVGSQKVRTATQEWVTYRWDSQVHGKRPKSSRAALNIIRPLQDPQDVDEFLTRLHGGRTIREGMAENQGPLLAFPNSTHGAAMGALSRGYATPQVIKGFRVAFKNSSNTVAAKAKKGKKGSH